MSDTIDDFRALKEYRKEQRRLLGVDCPGCLKKWPKAQPKKLLPGQRCRCGYVDPRPEQ